ncbi:MAG: HupE/UreJ family protein [Granulosicoccus sp.]|nr:HupE/UreJ family protein [Granulosicoccus sp.]
MAELRVAEHTLTASIRLNLEALISQTATEHQDSDDTPQAQRYDQLRRMSPELLAEAFRENQSGFLDGIDLRNQGGLRLALNVESLRIPPVGDIRLPRDTVLLLTTVLDEGTRSVSWRWARANGAIILRAEAIAESRIVNHRSTEAGADRNDPLSVSIDTSARSFSQLVRPGEKSDLIAIEPGETRSPGSTFLDYLILGYQHIIPKGLDHILFVIGLFLLTPRLRPILWQVSMFTLAHTLTLALGVTGLVDLPARLVEPLIALSISVICIENLMGCEFRSRRLALVFAFGLLHGLGFAGVLSDIGLSPGHFISSLLAFNLGVELGQLSVILLCFALAGWWFGNRDWYRRLVSLPASLLIGTVGVIWFLQRLQITL